MDDAAALILSLLFLGLLLAVIVFPIVALVISIRTKRSVARHLSFISQGTSPLSLNQQASSVTPTSITDSLKQLEERVARLEAASQAPFPVAAKAASPPQPSQPSAAATLPPTEGAMPAPSSTSTVSPQQPTPLFSSHSTAAQPLRAEEIESLIGRRWVGWAAVVIILFATAFFLKYAFDNRWIGELGRVALGILGGIILISLGFRYHRRRWRIFSQILTGGGVVLLYLSIYASFGYYHLASQKTAFIYLAILIAESALLALVYNAPAIAVMAIIVGFLNPLLLYTERDQYRSLFMYIGALDLGTVALLRWWPGLSSLAYLGTHLLFWLWFGDHYHPAKLGAVMTFQTAVFAMFLIAHVRRQVGGDFSRAEDLALLMINPFVFFATSYYLLNPEHHDWMGALAIGMSLVYASLAKFLLDWSPDKLWPRLLSLGIAVTFVTLAIPIQCKANWITIAWAVEALVMLWAALELYSDKLRITSHFVLAFALLRLVLRDTPYQRQLFTPVVNKYFLSSLAVGGSIFATAYLFRRAAQRNQTSFVRVALVFVVLGLAVLWFIMSVETLTFFYARAASPKYAADMAHQRWLGQMALSVLWSIYASLLAGIGFIRRVSALRWAALSLFAVTVIKAMLVDIAVLQQLYRIVVFFVLGLLLLLVAWAYHKVFYSKESPA